MTFVFVYFLYFGVFFATPLAWAPDVLDDVFTDLETSSRIHSTRSSTGCRCCTKITTTPALPCLQHPMSNLPCLEVSQCRATTCICFANGLVFHFIGISDQSVWLPADPSKVDRDISWQLFQSQTRVKLFVSLEHIRTFNVQAWLRTVVTCRNTACLVRLVLALRFRTCWSLSVEFMCTTNGLQNGAEHQFDDPTDKSSPKDKSGLLCRPFLTLLACILC